jgi:hypothetical protein
MDPATAAGAASGSTGSWLLMFLLSWVLGFYSCFVVQRSKIYVVFFGGRLGTFSLGW